MDEVPELFGIDSAVRHEGREHDRRAPDYLAANHEEAAGKAERLPLQRNLGKQQMRGGTADIDADRAQLDVVLAPDEAGEFLAVSLRGVFVLKIQFVHGPSAWMNAAGQPRCSPSMVGKRRKGIGVPDPGVWMPRAL